MALAGLKAVSLAYLLGLLALTLIAAYWHVLGRSVAPRRKAGVAIWLLCSSTVLSLAAAAYIFWGVVSHRILMSTDYFHQLMHGGWAAAIVLGGLIVLCLSLVLAFVSWRRSRVPRSGALLETAGGIPVRASAVPETASLVGVIRPEIWVNADYWNTLDETGRQAAVVHELEHLRRNDNLRKLVVHFITTLYFAVPWIRVWSGRFDLYTELAVDDSCERKLGRAAYLGLLGGAAGFMLRGAPQTVASSLGQSDIIERLRTLECRQRTENPLQTWTVGVSGAALSVLPAVALLLHPVPRCLLACYLGY